LGTGRQIKIISIIVILSCTIFLAANIIFAVRTSTLIEKEKKEAASLAKSGEDLKIAGDELKKYRYLLANLNAILFKTIYFGKAESNDTSSEHFFTAFSLFYKNRYYLISAGHSVELAGKKYGNFQFKPNYVDTWINPELLYYKNDTDNNNDFAVFKDSFVVNGLYPAGSNLKPDFIAGNTTKNANIIKEYKGDVTAVFGESGSPVLNSECRVVGILIKNKGEYTEISKVLAYLDSIPGK
jgi:hypothetical protein